jgi:hypothetical protein
MSALPLNAILENYFYINGQNGVCNVLKLKITKNIPGQKILQFIVPENSGYKGIIDCSLEYIGKSQHIIVIIFKHL